MEEFEREIKEIKEEINNLRLILNAYYKYIKIEIIEICRCANHGIYLTQNNFERTLDVLLEYSYHVDVDEEFELITNTYISIYPDSVEQYIKYYNE